VWKSSVSIGLPERPARVTVTGKGEVKIEPPKWPKHMEEKRKRKRERKLGKERALAARGEERSGRDGIAERDGMSEKDGGSSAGTKKQQKQRRWVYAEQHYSESRHVHFREAME
jgi:hypothetical protein